MEILPVAASASAAVEIGSRWNRCDASQTVDAPPRSATATRVRRSAGVSLPSRESPISLGMSGLAQERRSAASEDPGGDFLGKQLHLVEQFLDIVGGEIQ